MIHYRDRIVSAALGALRARVHFTYEEIRPVPYEKFMHLMDGHEVQVVTDCSGLATCCFYRAGLPDPNGKKYDGEAYTGYLLDGHLKPKSREKLLHGDLCVLGAYPGRHVVVAVEDGWDPLCVSHGKQGDPHIEHLSFFLGLGPLTVLDARSAVLPRRKKRKTAKWVVTGDGGAVISHVYSTRFGWYAKHLPLARRQSGKLHFDRIRPHRSGISNPPALEEV